MMAQTKATNIPTKTLPAGFTDLASVVRNGAKPAVNVIGVVVDCMNPSPTKGTDMQMTIRIRDTSPLPNGMRVKFFFRSPELFPEIHGPGDVVLIRNLKITTFAQEIMGISSFRTSFNVFPKIDVGSPAGGKSLRQNGSTGAPSPNNHEQKWVVSLHQSINGASLDQATPASCSKPSISTVTASSSSAQTPVSRTVVQPSARDKFSLIKDIEAGKFYDLAGEVVKLYFEQLGFGILDLYLTDYTPNPKLMDRQASQPADNSPNRWRGPPGKMTLHIEVHPPHSVWVQQNISLGEFVLLKNVRIKYNQRGLGTELEGNIWSDQHYPDRINVSALHSDHHRYLELESRKNALNEPSKPTPNTESNRSKKKKRKQRQKERAEQEAKRQKLETEASNTEIENSPGPETLAETKQTESSDEKHSPPTTNLLNPNVVCDHSDHPLRDIDLIINNPARLVLLPNGEKQEFPFVPRKYHAHLRVVDFLPHELESFAVLDVDPKDPLKDIWQWRFWLTLAQDEVIDSDNPSTVSVEVHGEDADYLLQMAPSDLSRDPKKLYQLEETLFLLWGELAERKAKFIRGHPHIKLDSSFSALKYNLVPSNRLVDLCVNEYGIKREVLGETSGNEYADPWKKWKRGYRMFGTKIKR